MKSNRYLAEALRGLAADVRSGQASEYHAVVLERIAGEVEALKSRDLIGQVRS